jgi:hypothetical protein
MGEKTVNIAGVAQLVEHQPSKLRVAGSSLVARSNEFEIVLSCPDGLGSVRRCSSGVERFLGKEKVTGSNPVIGSDSFKRENKQLKPWQRRILSVISRI